MKRIYQITTTLDLTPKQMSVVAFLGTFVTVIGAVILAFYFRRKNRKLALAN